jgi:hypothetical protein
MTDPYGTRRAGNSASCKLWVDREPSRERLASVLVLAVILLRLGSEDWADVAPTDLRRTAHAFYVAARSKDKYALTPFLADRFRIVQSIGYSHPEQSRSGDIFFTLFDDPIDSVTTQVVRRSRTAIQAKAIAQWALGFGLQVRGRPEANAYQLEASSDRG